MFSAIIEAVRFATTTGSGANNDEDDTVQASDSSFAETLNPLQAQKRDFNGTVTQVGTGYGIVDDVVFFNMTSIVGRVSVKVGSRVNVIASRDREEGGWKATRVFVLSRDDDWTLDMGVEKNKDGEDVENTIGTVSRSPSGQWVISDNLNFDSTSLVFGYQPFKGDIVQVEVTTCRKTSVSKVTSVKPLRETSGPGYITHLNMERSFGYVDGKVFFPFSACQYGYRPVKGDYVYAEAIESKQQKTNWRAVSICPTKNKASTNKNFNVKISPLDKKNNEELLKNKKGVVITENLDFGEIVIGNTKYLTAWIRNPGKESHVIKSCHLSSGNKQLKLVYLSDDSKDASNGISNKTLQPESSTYINIICKAQDLGRMKEMLLFKFDSFQIGRHITANVVDPLGDQLNPISVFKKKPANKDIFTTEGSSAFKSVQLIQGERPFQRLHVWSVPVRLPSYPIPHILRDSFNEKDELLSLVPELGELLTMGRYMKRFSSLIYIEEIKMENDMRDFDLERVKLEKQGEYMVLEVPGLAEGRPSLLIGDQVILSDPESPDENLYYEGYVHEIFNDRVRLKFNPRFHEEYVFEEYNAMFMFSRTSFKRCHQAVDNAKNLGENILFPLDLKLQPPQNNLKLCIRREKNEKRTIGTQTSKMISNYQFDSTSCKLKMVTMAEEIVYPQRSFFQNGDQCKTQILIPAIMKNKKTTGFILPVVEQRDGSVFKNVQTGYFFNEKLNMKQRIAVKRILKGNCHPTPYILFGPPGTGKTVTIVEAILQVFSHISSSRILVATPSNSAADLLAERLHESRAIKKSDMVRLNAFQRNEENIPESIKPYCQFGDNLEKIAFHRIIVSTCATSGLLYTLGLKAGHFTHVFVDEAGQAMEPECLVPIAVGAGPNGHIVLAGDPMQLGPIINNKVALELGLGQSLLERLMSRPLYRRDEKKFKGYGSYNPFLVTKLVQNYRSHFALLKLASNLFYHGELEACADNKIQECLIDWDMLPNRNNFPLVFHGIRGEDMREGNSPSWFNPVEAVQVMKYLQGLFKSQSHILQNSDVGVITPYRKQVEKIRLLLDRLGMSDIKVGSVEEFQGQERLVTIISTVRSNESFIQFDARHNLGFLSNFKRFNVTITRAQSLLIIVGNPYILAQDPHWLSLLEYARDNNAYVGCSLPDLSEYKLTLAEDLDVRGSEGVSLSSDSVMENNSSRSSDVPCFVEPSQKDECPQKGNMSSFKDNMPEENKEDIVTDSSSEQVEENANSETKYDDGMASLEEDVLCQSHSRESGALFSSYASGLSSFDQAEEENVDNVADDDDNMPSFEEGDVRQSNHGALFSSHASGYSTFEQAEEYADSVAEDYDDMPDLEEGDALCRPHDKESGALFSSYASGVSSYAQAEDMANDDDSIPSFEEEDSKESGALFFSYASGVSSCEQFEDMVNNDDYIPGLEEEEDSILKESGAISSSYASGSSRVGTNCDGSRLFTADNADESGKYESCSHMSWADQMDADEADYEPEVDSLQSAEADFPGAWSPSVNTISTPLPRHGSGERRNKRIACSFTQSLDKSEKY